MQEVDFNQTIIRRKVKVYVDISLKDDNTFTIGQRLVSFFGQASIFENTENITDFLEEYLDSYSLNFLTFGEDEFFENDSLHEDLAETADEEELFSDEETVKNVFFLPIIIYFYYSDKRTDFFILNIYQHRYQLNIHKWSLIVNFLKFKEKKINFFSNIFYFSNVKNYINNIKFLKNLHNSKLTHLIDLTTQTFLIPEEFLYPYWSNHIYQLRRRKNKFSFFKFYKYKIKKNTINLFKNLFSLPIFYIFTVISNKVNYLDEDFDYNDFIVNLIRYGSQLYLSKRSIFRRLRRRRRFKKKTVRNFFGDKTTYYKIYAYAQNKKKRRR